MSSTPYSSIENLNWKGFPLGFELQKWKEESPNKNKNKNTKIKMKYK